MGQARPVCCVMCLGQVGIALSGSVFTRTGRLPRMGVAWACEGVGYTYIPIEIVSAHICEVVIGIIYVYLLLSARPRGPMNHLVNFKLKRREEKELGAFQVLQPIQCIYQKRKGFWILSKFGNQSSVCKE